MDQVDFKSGIKNLIQIKETVNNELVSLLNQLAGLGQSKTSRQLSETMQQARRNLDKSSAALKFSTQVLPYLS